MPIQGSLGASGDLAPLAHIALVMIGLGEAEFGGQRMSGAEALAAAGLAPVELAAKEGLALTNGTALMAALGSSGRGRGGECRGSWPISPARSAWRRCTARCGPSTRASTPFGRIRARWSAPAACAACSKVPPSCAPGDHPDVQDAYTLRCIPQVHGACHDAIKYARWVVEIELNSATDNPLIFWEEDGSPVAISGGNFHGEPLAIAFDYLALGMTELGNMSERRLDAWLDGWIEQPARPARLPDPATAASTPASC